METRVSLKYFVNGVPIMLPARKREKQKTLQEEHNSKTFGLRLLLVVYLMN